MDNSDTSGVDSSSLSPPPGAPGDLVNVGAAPIRRSFSFDSFSRLEVGTDITTSSNVEEERLLAGITDGDAVFRDALLFPIHLSSVDFDLMAGFGDGGGEMNSEEGLVLMLLPLLFRFLCEEADLVLR